MHVLDNPAWAALSSCHADLAVGGPRVRRYPDQLAPIAAIDRASAAAFADLAALVPPGDWISLPATLDDLLPLVRAPLTVRFTSTLVQMVCERRVAPHPSDPELTVLSSADVADMLALTKLTNPGPFRSETYTLGTYLGVRVAGRLAAMGGQRMHLPGYREVSAICTHPDFRGQGYARAIVAQLAAAIFAEGLTPFLHVQEENRAAQAVYAGLGFVVRARLPLLVLDRT
jgi:predicted GNAT family acetyltransferase